MPIEASGVDVANWSGSSEGLSTLLSRRRTFTKTLLRGYRNAAQKSRSLIGKQLMIAMKLTVLLLTVAFLHVHATGTGQTVTLSGKDMNLQKVFTAIQKQTGFVVFYNREILADTKPVDVTAHDMPLLDLLNMILKDQPVEYFIKDRTIILSEKKLIAPPAKQMMIRLYEEQAPPVTGMIVNNDGQPLVGASVKIKGTSIGTVTDASGKFSLAADPGQTLVISFIGFASQEYKVVAGKQINVTLQRSANSLDETVVVGYGTSKRKDLTGAVSSVNVKEFKDVPFATIDQALTGKAAGVQVVQADGSPGGVAKIRIRGGTSLLGGNDPLYIIDGVQVQVQNRYLQSAADIVSPVESFGGMGGGDNTANTISGSFARGLNSLGGLNINDIESIDILKDASATAIYGSRAANGVVIITTKKGKLNQKPVVEANYYTGFSSAIKEKLLNRDQYIMIMTEAAKNLNNIRAGLNPALPPDAVASAIIADPDYLGTGNTDWLDLVLRRGITQNADLSVRGGGTGSRYYTSLSYNRNNGVVKGTDYTRLAGKVNLDNEITGKLRIVTNLDYGFSTNNVSNGVYTQAMFAPPTMKAYNEDGSVHVMDPEENGSYGFEGFQSPLTLLSGINKSNTVSLLGSLAVEYDILKGLKFRSSASVNYNSYHQTNYVPSTVLISDKAAGNWPGSSNNGIATQAQSQSTDGFFENTITWDKEFNENNRINVLGGTSWQISKRNSFSASGQGFPDDVYLNNISSAALTLPSTGVAGQNSLLSFYMRANYALYERYLFTFTGRSDASSKFPKGNRVGYFPSGGVAWRVSQENFMKNVPWIDELKIRASAGYTGTQNIGDNLFYTLYSPVSYNGLNGMSPSQLGNGGIKWETTLQKDAGVDFQLFKSRITGSIGYYEKSTTGVLFPTNVASSAGFTNVTANIADIRNRGLEFTIKADFIRNRDFQWSGTLNIAGNRSKVLALNNEFTDPANPGVYRYGNTVLKVGEPLGLLYGGVFEGVMKNQKDVDDYLSHNLMSLYGVLNYVGIGDARYALDTPIYMGYSDYKYDIIGHAEPKYYGGFTNSLTYKNFNLIALFTFSNGGDIYYLADVQNQSTVVRTNKGVRILDRWTPENPNADRPKLVLGDGSYNTMQANNNVYKANYIKLKSVTLNYQFPKSVLDRLKIANASIYASATNLFTITKYPGADPEVSNDPYSLIGGYSDSGGYPTVKQFNLGIRVGF